MRFLTRQEATYRHGVIDSGWHKDHARRQGLTLACRIGGVVYEAREGEVLHADIAIRAFNEGASGMVEDGWTEGGE